MNRSSAFLTLVTLWTGCDSASAPPGNATDEPTAKPNIIVYLVDTLRPDRLGVYGLTPSVSPHIDAFAATATVFDRAVAPSPWTRASVASLFTGLEPNRHQVNDRADALPAEAVTLAELLSAGGYQTVGVISNVNIAREFGFDQGFDEYIRVLPPSNLSRQVNEEVYRFLESGRLREPFFLYVHTIDPHPPYSPRLSEHHGLDPAWMELGTMDVLKAFQGERTANSDEQEVVVSLYDAEVEDNDGSFGAFLRELRKRGLYEDSLVAFVADHGEEFWEHGSWGHGHSLYREVVDIPFIMKRPRQKTGSRDSRLAQLIDLMPTALDYADLAIPEHLSGISLKEPADLSLRSEPRPAYSLMDLDGRLAASVTLPDYKLIVFRSGAKEGRSEVFSYETDRFESSELSASALVITRHLTALLEAKENLATAGEASAPPSLDEDLVRELKSLGYLE